jgi:hypothetical protein
MSGRHSPVPQVEMSAKPPLGMTPTPRSPSDEHDADEGLLGVSIEEGSADIYPSAQVKPKGGQNRLAALRGRRRTYDVNAEQLPTSPHNSVRAFPGHKGSKSHDSVAGGPMHVRGGSGNTLSAIMGLSSSTNRVSPGAWAEGEL